MIDPLNISKGSSLDKMINGILAMPAYRDYTRTDIIDYLNRISWHESRYNNIPTQVKNSTGRYATSAKGYFQMTDGFVQTAHNKMYSLFKQWGYEAPEMKYSLNGMDYSFEDQAALTLAGDIALSNAKGNKLDFYNPGTTWLDDHWAGKAQHRQAAARQWNESMKAYDGKKQITALSGIPVGNVNMDEYARVKAGFYPRTANADIDGDRLKILAASLKDYDIDINKMIKPIVQ